MEQKRLFPRLEQELMLQINERLYRSGILPREVYEEAKVKIVAGNSKEIQVGHL